MNPNQSPASSEEETSSVDMASSTTSSISSRSTTRRTNKSEFPIKLYAMLELAENLFEFSQAVTWLPHGRAFRILNKVKFMEEVVPLFFNQTKIRSFSRQLHLWGFRRIGRGNEQVWYHDNFLRGMPESMNHMVRTKIKGNSNSTVDSSDDDRAPNFDILPPLPVNNKQPSPAVLNEMEKAILKLQSSPGVMAHRDLTMAPLSCPETTNNFIDSATMAPLSCPETTNFTGATMAPAPLSCPETTNNFIGATNHHLMVLPRTETPCDFSLDYNHDPSLLMTCHPLFSRAVSSESQWQRPFVPQADTTESTTYMNQTSVQGTYQPFQSSDTMLRIDDDDLCFSPPPLRNNYDFEPLPFRDDNELCDDFANFLQVAIQQVEG